MNKLFLCASIACALPSLSLAMEPDLFGSFRYRYERTDQDQASTSIRSRQRIKATFGAKAKVTEDLKATISLITGSDDPVSGNQTLTDGASTKSISLDIAQFDYSLTSSLMLSGGKMKQPFVKPLKSELIWDGDLRPEGLSLSHSWSSDAVEMKSIISHYELAERSGDSEATMDGIQVVPSIMIGKSKLTLGLGLYAFSHLKGRSPLYNSGSEGNTLDGSGNYLNGYAISEAFFTYYRKLGNLDFSLFLQGVKNSRVDNANKGFAKGFVLGKAKKKGTWQFGYSFKEVQKDAVIGRFTDSDFGGGGSDHKGHEANFKYALNDKATLGITHFYNQTTVVSTSKGYDYHKTQADFSFKF